MEAIASVRERLDLLDWRRRVFALYDEIRGSPDPRLGWERWRSVRDELIGSHPQSPIRGASRGAFDGLRYFAYDPALRVRPDVVHAAPEAVEVQGSAGSSFTMTRFATASFELQGQALSLGLYWIEGYAAGVFLSFRDATSGSETYGAGRYLLDTVKGADLGMEGGRLVLDFNFAYNPSCAYDPRWACPLAPPANRLPVPVRTGERIA